MKNLNHHIALVLCAILSCNPQKDNSKALLFKDMGYSRPNLFLYEVTQTDSNNVFVHKDTLALFSSGIVLENMDGQTKMQWLAVSMDDSTKKYAIENFGSGVTGIKSNDSVLFIHPPRYDRYQILEFCPHPLFYLKTDSGTWNWDLGIGAGYALPDYPVSDVDTFRIRYSFTDMVTMKLAPGAIFCHKVNAISRSPYGTGYASYYLNNQYGLVKFTFQPVNRSTYEFRLMFSTSQPDSTRFSHRLLYYYNNNFKRGNETRY